MSAETISADEFVIMSKRFLLLLEWDLNKGDDGKVNGVTRDDILDADPSEFNSKYQTMLQAFGEDKAQLSCFCGEYDNPLKISFTDMCIAMANCIFNKRAINELIDLSGLKGVGTLRSPILFLCDALYGKTSDTQVYCYFGKNCDGSPIIGQNYDVLFNFVKFTAGGKPNLDNLSQITKEKLKELCDASEKILAAQPKSEPEPKLEPEKEKDSCLSNPPSKCERVIGHILCFFCFGGCGVLSITAFNAALDFTTSVLILPSLSYGANLAVGAFSAAATIAFGILTLFRIIISKEKQNELQTFMEEAKNPFKKFWYRTIGACAYTYETKEKDALLGTAF
jgi:hypothetical protein